MACLIFANASSISLSYFIASYAASNSWPILFVKVRISCINIFVTIPVVASVCNIFNSSCKSLISSSWRICNESTSRSTSSGLIAGASDWFFKWASCSFSSKFFLFSNSTCSSCFFSASQRFLSSANLRIFSICSWSSSCSFLYWANLRPINCLSASNSWITAINTLFNCSNPSPSWIPFLFAASSKFLFFLEISTNPIICSDATRHLPVGWPKPAGDLLTLAASSSQSKSLSPYSPYGRTLKWSL